MDAFFALDAILLQTLFYEVMGGKRDKMIYTVCKGIG